MYALATNHNKTRKVAPSSEMKATLPQFDNERETNNSPKLSAGSLSPILRQDQNILMASFFSIQASRNLIAWIHWQPHRTFFKNSKQYLSCAFVSQAAGGFHNLCCLKKQQQLQACFGRCVPIGSLAVEESGLDAMYFANRLISAEFASTSVRLCRKYCTCSTQHQ